MNIRHISCRSTRCLIVNLAVICISCFVMLFFGKKLMPCFARIEINGIATYTLPPSTSVFTDTLDKFIQCIQDNLRRPVAFHQ